MNCTEPPLTTVRQPIEAMGRAAVDLLAGLIAGRPVESDELLFEPELVVRGSTGTGPPPRPDVAPATSSFVNGSSTVAEFDFLVIYVDSCVMMSPRYRDRRGAGTPR